VEQQHAVQHAALQAGWRVAGVNEAGEPLQVLSASTSSEEEGRRGESMEVSPVTL
jgi:hypothetical protein